MYISTRCNGEPEGERALRSSLPPSLPPSLRRHHVYHVCSIQMDRVRKLHPGLLASRWGYTSLSFCSSCSRSSHWPPPPPRYVPSPCLDTVLLLSFYPIIVPFPATPLPLSCSSVIFSSTKFLAFSYSCYIVPNLLPHTPPSYLTKLLYAPLLLFVS